MKTKHFLLVLPLLALGFFAYSLMMPKDSQFGFFQMSESTRKVITMIYGYVITLLGVLFGAAYRSLQEYQKTSPEIPGLKWLAKRIFLSVELWLGIFGSPLAFALILQSISLANLSAITVIAIQNGFCCTIIVSAFLTKQQAAQANPGTGDATKTTSA